MAGNNKVRRQDKRKGQGKIMLDFFKKLVLTSKNDTSPANSLDKTDWGKIVRETLVAAASAGLTVLINYEGSLDLGPYTALLMPGVHFVLTAALKWVRDNSVAK